MRVDLDPKRINFDLARVRQTLILRQSFSKSPTCFKLLFSNDYSVKAVESEGELNLRDRFHLT